MPEVCRFYGIIIRFYYREHPPTHFHALYGEHEALIEIETGDVYQGWLPQTAYDLVIPDRSSESKMQPRMDTNKHESKAGEPRMTRITRIISEGIP